MNKDQLLKEIVSVLKENDIKKSFSIPKRSFTISDNEGSSKTFYVKSENKSEAFTVADVCNIIDAALCVLKDRMKKGDPITIRGIGSLGVRYRRPRQIKNVTGEEVLVQGRYVPNFKFGNELRMCARVYGMSKGDHLPESEPFYDDDDFEEFIDDESGDE